MRKVLQKNHKVNLKQCIRLLTEIKFCNHTPSSLLKKSHYFNTRKLKMHLNIYFAKACEKIYL